jgi:hypothetical protein
MDRSLRSDLSDNSGFVIANACFEFLRVPGLCDCLEPIKPIHSRHSQGNIPESR